MTDVGFGTASSDGLVDVVSAPLGTVGVISEVFGGRVVLKGSCGLLTAAASLVLPPSLFLARPAMAIAIMTINSRNPTTKIICLILLRLIFVVEATLESHTPASSSSTGEDG